MAYLIADRKRHSMAATMPGMQVLIFEIRNSVGLAKSYAQHQLDLHMLVLSHLRKTYWTADLQHNLFTEVLKAMNGASCHAETDAAPAQPNRDQPVADQHEQAAQEMFNAEHGLTSATFEDFFLTFNPFMGMNAHTDELR